MCAAKKQRWGQSWGRRGVGERGLYKWGVGVILVGVHQIIRIILIYYYVNVKLIDCCVKLKSLSPLFCVWIWKTEDFYYRKQMVNSAFLVFLRVFPIQATFMYLCCYVLLPTVLFIHTQIHHWCLNSVHFYLYNTKCTHSCTVDEPGSFPIFKTFTVRTLNYLESWSCRSDKYVRNKKHYDKNIKKIAI